MVKNKIFGVVGVYMGLWVGFIGGIVQTVEAIKALEIESMIASFFTQKRGY